MYSLQMYAFTFIENTLIELEKLINNKKIHFLSCGILVLLVHLLKIGQTQKLLTGRIKRTNVSTSYICFPPFGNCR